MKREQFDHFLSEIRNEQVDDSVVTDAGQRVWNSIAGVSAADPNLPVLRTCADFQSLIPTFLNRTLSPARVLLFEDHVHACVPCRHALDRARVTEPQIVFRLEPAGRSSTIWRWTAGVAAVAAIALVTFLFDQGLLPGQHAVRAEVQSIDGSLYSVGETNVQLIPAGYAIRNDQEIHTAKDSTAIVRLLDGSLVEVGPRSELEVSRGWRGTTIHLDGGQVIVQAAKQRSGRLYLATDDCLLSVKGTIFSVNHGIKGSRVSVIEGVVRMDSGDRVAELHAGEQASSNASVSKVPIQNDIAWSRNAAKYLALLGDFAVLQKQFAAIPGPGLRYSSDLLPLVPEHTVIYAAIPNLANTLVEADRLFQQRLQQSPALQDWWQQQKNRGSNLEDVLDRVKGFSNYLGDEIVFAAGKDGTTYTAPIILARVRQAGLQDYLQNEAAQLNSKTGHAGLQTVRDPWATTPTPGHPLLVYVKNDLMIASPDLSQLQHAVLRTQAGGGNPFSTTSFHQQIADAYQAGVEWLFCADLEQIVVHNVHMGSQAKALPAGLGDVRYLTMEHRDLGGKSESQAAVSFASERQGIASWLASPASMGSLDFVSPDASMVTSAVIKNPRSIMEEVFQMIGASDADFEQNLAQFESKSGVNVLNDVAAPLGGEVTMAFDGAVLPTPQWKLIVEVYDPTTLQATIEKLAESFNREGAAKGHSLVLTKKQVGSQTYYTIRSSNAPGPNSELDYAFVDSYLIAAPEIGTISRAIQSRQAGYTLPRSATFQALLPKDGYTNFSGIFYHNIGPVIAPIAEQLKSSGALTPQQRQSIDELSANSAPGLIYAYGQPDRIVVASNTGFMGFDLGTLLTMGHHGPLFPQLLLRGTLTHPNPQAP